MLDYGILFLSKQDFFPLTNVGAYIHYFVYNDYIHFKNKLQQLQTKKSRVCAAKYN